VPFRNLQSALGRSSLVKASQGSAKAAVKPETWASQAWSRDMKTQQSMLT
jgi:hypothetical protein